MSRQIDLTQPLSDEDRVYLEDRCETYKLSENAALLKGKEFAEPVLAPVQDQDPAPEDEDPAPVQDEVEDAELAEPMEEKVSRKK